MGQNKQSKRCGRQKNTPRGHDPGGEELARPAVSPRARMKSAYSAAN